MIAEMLLFSALGSALGVATGLVPGLHVNNTIPMLLPLALLLGDPHYVAVLIVSTAVSQSLVSFIPSIFLGAPEADTSLSTLPGHRLLHEGRGYEAIKLTVVGGLGSVAVSMGVMLALYSWFPAIYDMSRPYVLYVLLGMTGFMLLSEGRARRVLGACAVFAMSGMLGLLVLQSPLMNQQTVLFPTLAGLFGLSVLVTSIFQRSSIPPQSGDSRMLVGRWDLAKSIALGSAAGLVVGFLPAVGVSQAAAMFQSVGGLGDPRYFLSSLSGIGMANEVFSINSVHLIGNPRSGASVAIERLLGEVTASDVFLFVSVCVFSAGVGAAASLFLGRRVPPLLARLSYRWLSFGIISMIAGMVVLLTGPWGALVAGTGAAIGVLCERMGIRRSSCMGVLILPSLLFFSGLSPHASSLLGL